MLWKRVWQTYAVVLMVLALVSTSYANNTEPVFVSRPARIKLEVSPWQLSPSGGWRAIAQIHYLDSSGNELKLNNYYSGFLVSGAEKRTLANWVNHTRSVLILLNRAGSVKVTAWSKVPKLDSRIVWLKAPADDIAHFAVVAQNVGPYANAIAWTPLAKFNGIKNYQVWRNGNGNNKLVATLSAKQTHYFDSSSIQANQQYQYTVKVISQAQSELKAAKSPMIKTMPPLPKESVKNFNGKGVFLSFSPSEDAKNSYSKFPVAAIINQARAAKLDFVELQMQYGEFPRIKDPAVKAWYEDLLDAAHANHIKVIAWVTPCVANIETIYNTVQFLDDHSSRGDSLDGVALDIEPGDSFMGDHATFPAEAIKYISELKAAVGSYPLTVIVSPPHILTTYPYAQMARYVDLVAPMLFWHHHPISRKFSYNQSFVVDYCNKKIAIVRSKLQKNLPILMIAQSADLGNTGVPSTREVNWALNTAKKSGAVGVSFFDWHGLHKDLWSLLAGYNF